MWRAVYQPQRSNTMTGMMTPNGILVRQGDSFDIAMRFKHKDGTPLDISGSQVCLDVKDDEDNIILHINGDITDATNGYVVIKITPQHSNLNVGTYEANIKITFANGDVHTVFPQDLSQNAVFQISEGV